MTNGSARHVPRALARRAKRAVGSVRERILGVPDWAADLRASASWRRGAVDRGTTPFSREDVLARFARTVEIEGRNYSYVLYPGDTDALCIHFSAFFGEWGDQREYRAQYQGHFHRLRMFWPMRRYAFLFLCDTFGADRNGTYYKGEQQDFFVERAVNGIMDTVCGELNATQDRTIAMGSSMGATAALRFALQRQFAGAIAVAPHIDLDISGIMQGRQRHVAAVLGTDDITNPKWSAITREVRKLSETTSVGPRIVLQSMRDDLGVHSEQVIPFAEGWRDRGGAIRLDERATGGHTSEYATAEWFDEQIRWCLGEEPEDARPGRPQRSK